MAKIIVANWKMNGSLAFMKTWVPALTSDLASTSNQVIICPPFPFLFPLSAALKGTSAHLGAQNCHTTPHGPFTGEVSAAMLADIGCQAVIVGHSERRTLFSETNDLIKAKAEAVHAAGMTAIICIGESLTIRQSGRAIDTVIQQCQASLPPSATPENTRVAYEPLWAIGTGLTASLREITEMHQALHAATKVPIPLLYGGSVTEENATDILSLPHVDGVLVGGASLNMAAFQKIIR
ncbi:MAG: tpiA [Alphaproteobacteria bacterium]|jgi:triosephosphate isomerase|nr:tpiA [Alphaproteobacteria bacterium]